MPALVEPVRHELGVLDADAEAERTHPPESVTLSSTAWRIERAPGRRCRCRRSLSSAGVVARPRFQRTVRQVGVVVRRRSTGTGPAGCVPALPRAAARRRVRPSNHADVLAVGALGRRGEAEQHAWAGGGRSSRRVGRGPRRGGTRRRSPCRSVVGVEIVEPSRCSDWTDAKTWRHSLGRSPPTKRSPNVPSRRTCRNVDRLCSRISLAVGDEQERVDAAGAAEPAVVERRRRRSCRCRSP